MNWPLFQEVHKWRSNVETQVNTCQNVSSVLCFLPQLVNLIVNTVEHNPYS